MGIFSRHKKAKTEATPVADKPKPAPYKHIPTHAAIDALTGAPSVFRSDDAMKVVDHNKRRSQMSRSNSEMSLAKWSEVRPNGLPRVGSAYSMNNSTMSLPAVPAIPEKHLRTSVPPSPRSERAMQSPNAVQRAYGGHHGGWTIGKSPLSTPLETEANSPVESSKSSTSSSHSSRELEMRRVSFSEQQVFKDMQHKDSHHHYQQQQQQQQQQQPPRSYNNGRYQYANSRPAIAPIQSGIPLQDIYPTPEVSPTKEEHIVHTQELLTGHNMRGFHRNNAVMAM